MTFIPAFSEPQSHWPRAPPPPVLGQSGGEARAAGVAPRGNPTILTHTGRIGPHPRFSNLSIHLQLQQRGDENGDPQGRNRPARCGNPNPASRSLSGWGSGSKIKPAPPGDDRVPPPDQKSLHTSRTPTTRGRKRRFPGSIPPRRVWKPQPHWVIADWLGIVESQRCLLYTSPSPRDLSTSRMPSSA